MTEIKSYKDLIVWQKSIELTKAVYTITADFPKSETYALTSQMQRAAVSIASNIAEGHTRNHTNEFIQFLSIANGSVSELETQIIIAKSQYQKIDYQTIDNLLNEIQRMLNVLIKKLKS